VRALPSKAKQNRIKVTTIQPGNVAADLLALSSDEESLKLYGQQSGASVLYPEDVAASVVHSLEQLDYVAVSVILVDPRSEPV
jgi:NADP-dependent 3-hydroxy acid dehydrogenase YdfG